MSLGMPINCQYRTFLVGHILVTAMWQKYQQIGYEWSHTVSISNNNETVGRMPAFRVQNILPPHPIEWDTPLHHYESLFWIYFYSTMRAVQSCNDILCFAISTYCSWCTALYWRIAVLQYDLHCLKSTQNAPSCSFMKVLVSYQREVALMMQKR